MDSLDLALKGARLMDAAAFWKCTREQRDWIAAAVKHLCELPVKLEPALYIENDDADVCIGSDADLLGLNENDIRRAVYENAYRRGWVSPGGLADMLGLGVDAAYMIRGICADDSAFEDDGGGQRLDERYLYHEPGAAADSITPAEVPGDARQGWRYEIGHAHYRRALARRGQAYANRYWGEYAAPAVDGIRDGLEDRIAARRSLAAYAAAASRAQVAYHE